MTDAPGRNGGTDQLDERLRALAVDTDAVILAESSAVRRRGDRRRRTTRAGSALAVGVVVVGAVSATSAMTNRSDHADVIPGISTSLEPLHPALAADPLLRPGDIAAVGANETFTRAVDVPQRGFGLPCLSDPATWGANTSASETYVGDLDATIVETVLEFADVASAEAASERPAQEFATCLASDPASGTDVDRQTYDPAVPSHSYRFSRLTTPTGDAGLTYEEIGVTRSGNVVVVLDWTSLGRPYDSPAWALTPYQLSIALARATAPPLDPSMD